MADEIKETIETKTVETNYIETIEKLKAEKASMVSREEYNKAVSDNAKLLDALTTGQTIASKAQENEYKYTDEDIEKSARVMCDQNVSDLERFKATNDYHKAVLQKYGVDTYLPRGNKLNQVGNKIIDTGKSAITEENLERAKRTNEFIETAASFNNMKDLKRFLEDHLE